MSKATETTIINEKRQQDRKHRFSLQQNPTTEIKTILRPTQSFNKQTRVPTIPEVDVDENDGDVVQVRQHVRRDDADRASQQSKKSTRSASRHKGAYVNDGFEGDNGSSGNLQRATSKSSLSPSMLERGSASARSSTRQSSVSSLQVQVEQYWCFSKWSPCEKRLASCVAVLGTIIVILVIVVGVLAGTKGVDVKILHPLPH